jgi:hypothetical protein
MISPLRPDQSACVARRRGRAHGDAKGEGGYKPNDARQVTGAICEHTNLAHTGLLTAHQKSFRAMCLPFAAIRPSTARFTRASVSSRIWLAGTKRAHFSNMTCRYATSREA